jgi:hypothetical protein
MEDMNIRIQRVTEDLRVIQQELNFAAIEFPTDPEQKERLEELVSLEALRTLKSALDQMRHFLWFYFQVVGTESDIGEKLRQALVQPSEDEMESPPELRVEKVRHDADRAFLHYRLNGKKPN